ncbi:ATPase [Mycobacterium sp. CBMA271]|uniref:SRPBCC domain-containing protein n=1 Tax=unclassified Mycobacteroides TaxID=2618759 RepID=UPI001324E4A2|nr:MULTISPECIES: SRPBCC domain-containing protein [unclassified Mycobacteroides]MUM17632.1 ATPase [Mycobacteroides sp. CBMA 326]MUM23093.1 ATPase [Mycobacteroides sp. CBMA 271]
MTSRILVSLRVRATPQRAFDVFVSDIGMWWRPNTLFRFTRHRRGTLTIEPKLGGRFVESYPDGSDFEIGRVTTWEPGNRLGLTWRQESFTDDQMTAVEVRFEPVSHDNAETRVTVEHLGWETVPQDHVARHTFPDGLFLRRHGEWWQDLLDALRNHLA